MKHHILMVLVAIISLGFINCAGGKDVPLQQNPPFKVTTAYFQKWVAGVQGGGSGTNLHLEIEAGEPDIIYEVVYFQSKQATLLENPNKKGSYTANFLNESNRDVIMDESPVKESQNSPPEKIPFELKENEAVIRFVRNGETAYYKIENLEEKPLLAYPATNPNGID